MKLLSLFKMKNLHSCLYGLSLTLQLVILMTFRDPILMRKCWQNWRNFPRDISRNLLIFLPSFEIWWEVFPPWPCVGKLTCEPMNIVCEISGLHGWERSACASVGYMPFRVSDGSHNFARSWSLFTRQKLHFLGDFFLPLFDLPQTAESFLRPHEFYVNRQTSYCHSIQQNHW